MLSFVVRLGLLILPFTTFTTGFLAHRGKGNLSQANARIFVAKLNVSVKGDTKEERRNQLVIDFSNAVESSVTDQSFVSLVLRGKKKRQKQKGASKPSLDDGLRGAIRQVQGRLVELPKTKEIKLQLTVKYHGATDIARNVPPEDISDSLQSLFRSEQSSEISVVSEWGADAAANSLQGAELITTHTTLDLQLISPKLVRRRNTNGPLAKSAKAPLPPPHTTASKKFRYPTKRISSMF